MSSTATEGAVVCVTGASGYIASWLVKLLLLRGYTVHATLRSLNDPKKIEHLLALEGAKDRLRFFKSDLAEDASFDSAIAGCHGVFHTASPCFFRCNDPQVDLIDPAVQGTVNVLRSCAKASSVRRVVLTSSMSAVLRCGTPLTQEVVVDESWFSDTAICRKNELWYPLSKTLAEEAAWKFAKEKDIDLVVINPAFVIGAFLQPTLNESCATIFNLVGAETYPNKCCGWVHVKDVANAHIEAFQVESARGRYCLVERVIHYSEVVKLLRESYPTLPLPYQCYIIKFDSAALPPLYSTCRPVILLLCSTIYRGFSALGWICRIMWCHLIVCGYGSMFRSKASTCKIFLVSSQLSVCLITK